jgi:hypothetical protein
MEIARVALRRHRKGWGVEVTLEEGEVRRYRYGSEAQARYFAAVFELGPRWLPPVSRRSRRRSRAGASSAGREASGPEQAAGVRASPGPG